MLCKTLSKSAFNLPACNHNENNNHNTAVLRWKILSRVILHSSLLKSEMVSVYCTYNLFNLTPIKKELDNCDCSWFMYSGLFNDKLLTINIRHLLKTLSPEELIGFNNTGNVRVWPSEVTLAYYALCNKDLFDNKKVLEVGGGMTCLAGILVGKYTDCTCSHLSDGNETSVYNVNCIIEENDLSRCNVSCFVLKWSNYLFYAERYDIILAADCVFFDEFRLDLINALWHLLSDTGIVLLMAPKRGNTLMRFIEESTKIGFHCLLYHYYSKNIWKQHLQYLKYNKSYNEDTDFPLLLVLNKFPISGLLIIPVT